MKPPVQVLSMHPYIQPIQEWTKKRDQYLISPTGRWGFAWLRGLVFKAAYYLGMVSYHRSCTDSIRVVNVQVDTPTIRAQISECILDHIRCDEHLEDLVCIIGSQQWPELGAELRSEIHMRFGVPGIDNGFPNMPHATRFIQNNVPVIVSKFMQGFVVINRRLLDR